MDRSRRKRWGKLVLRAKKVENEKGVGKGTARKSLMKKYSAGGRCTSQYSVYTYIHIYRELERTRYK